jgi:molybdopterin molybdotransferase
VDATLDRKIVSAIGFTDLVRVRMARGRAAPLGSADQGGLASAVRADGFLIVPETSEGYPPGSSVRVHLYEDQRGELPHE